jgi:EAL domain-containing protein (putative c-di-GMP-specific phosphodiesterase class I)
VRALLLRTGAPARRLIFEITEGLLLERSDTVQSQMDELIALGIRFSIDDFGTGFSSLGYLKRLPIHEIKIDRSFIDGIPDDEGDMAIVRSVLLMARQFRLQVIAEGGERAPGRFSVCPWLRRPAGLSFLAPAAPAALAGALRPRRPPG